MIPEALRIFEMLLKHKLLIAGALYALALLPRLWGISWAPMQPDEVHWRARTRHTIELLKERSWQHATTHLGQPGVTPSLVMVLGQAAGSVLGLQRYCTPQEPCPYDSLTYARTANAVVSSLSAPVIFLGTVELLAPLPAALAGFFLAVDPNHTGLSRQAHLDTVLTLLVILTLVLYSKGQRSGRTRYVLAAGVFWGLSIATKPTAAATIPALLVYRVVRSRLHGKSWHSAFLGSVGWGDVWAVVVGHTVFTAVYTRLWHHPSDYLWRLHIKSPPADILFTMGSALQAGRLWVALLAAATVAIVLRSRRLTWVTHLSLLLAMLLAVSAFAPAVLENILRYWTWAAGLSGMKHVAYGMAAAPPQYGYPGLIAARLPVLILLLFAFGAAALLVRLRKERFEAEAAAFLILAVTALGCWIGLLGVSSKQTIRYIMPVLLAVWLLAALGFDELRRIAGSKLLSLGFSAVLICWLCAICLAEAPAYLFFYNSLSGGIRGAHERNSILAFAGLKEGLEFLRDDAVRRNRPLLVSVFGDIELLRAVKRRWFPESERRLELLPNENPNESDYVFRFGPFLEGDLPHADDLGEFLGVSRFVYARDGVKLAEIFEIPLFDYKTPFVFPLADAHRETGDRDLLEIEGREVRVLRADPKEHPRGFLVTNFPVRLPPGTYRFRLHYRPMTTPGSSLDTGRMALNFAAHSKCTRSFTVGEIASGEPLDLNCSFAKEAVPRITAFWRGTIAMALIDLEVSEVAASPSTFDKPAETNKPAPSS